MFFPLVLLLFSILILGKVMYLKINSEQDSFVSVYPLKDIVVLESSEF